MRNTTDQSVGRGRGEASKFRLSRIEKLKISLIYAAIVGATAFGFVAAFLIGQVSPVLAGLGLFTYALGLRHGVDADHIAAIDNTTRKLIQDDKRPFTVGMWFSLGHSAIVFLLVIGLVFATRAIRSQLPSVQNAGEIIGLAVSGTFLILIGLVNVLIVLGVYRVFVELKKGTRKPDLAEMEDLLDKRGGMLNRIFRSLYRLVKEPFYMFPVGVLFGLGFDTATEVLLVAISVGIGVSLTIPLWMVLILPFMFTCGMVLVDTTDGAVMRMAYGWAFINPLRKIYYNLTVTIVSVAVAFGIGGIELLQLIASRLNLGGPFWDALRGLNFEYIGVAIIVLFVASWTVSMAYWRYKRYDELFISV